MPRPEARHNGEAPGRPVLWLIGLIVVICFPMAAALGLYVVSDDPAMRPLGITQEAERAFATGRPEDLRPLVIAVSVAWVDGQAEGHTRTSLRRALVKAFEAKGVEQVTISFAPGAGRTMITYDVLESVVGPYPVSTAAQGINAAVQALDMAARARARSPPP